MAERPTSKERWEHLTPEAHAWLSHRLADIGKYSIPEGTDEKHSSPCFFCGKPEVHINGGGNAWEATIYTEGKQHNVLYCNVDKHDGPDACGEAEAAHNSALWYEEGSYDIIGLQGHKHTALTNPHES